MIKKILSSFSSALLLSGALTISSANAVEDLQSESPLDKLGATFVLDLMFGGEELGYISYDDGSTESVHAGSGLGFGAGVNYQATAQVNAEVRLSYLFDSISGDTAEGDTLEIDFTRFPLDVMAFYQHEKHNLGAGLTYHMSPTLSFGSQTTDFDAAIGSIFEYRYFYQPKISLSLKMVMIDYDYGQFSFDGNSFGFGIAGHF